MMPPQIDPMPTKKAVFVSLLPPILIFELGMKLIMADAAPQHNAANPGQPHNRAAIIVPTIAPVFFLGAGKCGIILLFSTALLLESNSM
jgi:hypothetical protein